jgi:hypothetical protein
MGRLVDLEQLIGDNQIETVIVASDAINADRLHIAAEVCLRTGIDLVRFSLAVRLVSVPSHTQAEAPWNVSSV